MTRLYAYISNGKLNLKPSSTRGLKPEISISFEEREKLVGYFADHIRSGRWDGHILCSSSMDFANEDGWPEAEAREYLDDCVVEALMRLRKERAN